MCEHCWCLLSITDIFFSVYHKLIWFGWLCRKKWSEVEMMKRLLMLYEPCLKWWRKRIRRCRRIRIKICDEDFVMIKNCWAMRNVRFANLVSYVHQCCCPMTHIHKDCLFVGFQLTHLYRDSFLVDFFDYLKVGVVDDMLIMTLICDLKRTIKDIFECSLWVCKTLRK